jgi:hypothetical protein
MGVNNQLTAQLDALWPAPAVVRPALLPRGADTYFLAVPSTRAPRLLVPAGVPGADRMLVRHGGGRRTRAARTAMRIVHRTLGSWAPVPRLGVSVDPAGVEQHLAAVIGRPVRVGVLLGPPRANIKPVLQVFAPDGTVLAFAKVATSAVSTPLLHAEAAALQRMTSHPVPGVVTPTLLDLGTWRDHAVLVQRALPSAQSGQQPRVLPAAALAGVTAAGGLRRTTLGDTAFWGRLTDLGPPTWHGADVSALTRLRDAIDPGTEVVLGAWHGDFGPWNAAWGADALEVWDWERFDPDVPAGLDAAHWRAQLDVGTDPQTAWESMRRDVTEVLEAVPEVADSALVAACYLLAIWTRYRQDAADSATAALRARVEWLCRVAEAAQPDMKGPR